jgi:uncharacterized membrane protein
MKIEVCSLVLLAVKAGLSFLMLWQMKAEDPSLVSCSLRRRKKKHLLNLKLSLCFLNCLTD